MATPMPSDSAPAETAKPRLKPEHQVLLALLCATIAKLAWAVSSIGTEDVVTFFKFGRVIEAVGLCRLYSLDPHFNHTPLTGGFVMLLCKLVGRDPFAFGVLLRLASILADVAVVLGFLRWRPLLRQQPPWWALILFALSPVSIMISGFHGNVDPLMTAALFFAALAAVRERPVLCGLLFGLACNVKIVPMVFGPVFFFFWLHRQRAWSFAWAAGVVLLAGSVWPLWVNPGAYLHNVFGYGSYWGTWGVPFMLRKMGVEAAQTMGFYDLNDWELRVTSLLKLAIVTGIFWLAWSRRQVKPAALPATLGLAWLVFFIFAPGGAVQYMVWLAPFLLLLDGRAYAVVTLFSAAYLVSFYQACSEGPWPWFLAAATGPEQVATSYWWGLVLWILFLGLFFRLILKARNENSVGEPGLETAPASLP